MQLTKAFSGYRLPRELDNSQDDIKYAVEHVGTACLGVAKADFDGDGQSDYLIGLTSVDGQDALVVVALARKSGWALHKLDTWKDGRSRLYVEADPAGKYDDVGDNDGPLEKGQVLTLRCPHSWAVFGATESSGVAYCYLDSVWKHVWISD